MKNLIQYFQTRNRKVNYLGLIFLLMSFSLFAQSTVLTDINDFIPEELKYAGFKIDSDQTIKIEAAGMEPDYPFRHSTMSHAWILNSKTREVVWNLRKAEEVDNSGRLSTFKDELELQPGTYEVYFSTFFYYPDGRGDRNYDWKGHRGLFSNLFHGLFHNEDYHRKRVDWDLFEDFYIKVTGSGKSLTDEDIIALNEAKWKNTLISEVQIKNDYFGKHMLKVDKPVDLEIYAIGEVSREGEYDFGKIVDVKTREIVWKLDYRNSDPAGGAYKNRMSTEKVTLPAGEYTVLYVTDDSHAYKRWNMHPPYDPLNWGLTIMLSDNDDAQNITLTEFEQIAEERKILEFKKMGDSDYKSKAFTLKEPLDLHIYAIGEGRDYDMYDFGRIVDAKTRKEVWRMEYDETESAGGSEKNRLFDEIVNFKPGDYIAYFITDGSHSYDDWNASPPYDQKSWGMSIYVNDENFEEGDFAEYELEENENILVQLIRLGDYEKKHKSFTMDKDGLVHVYALGEGTYGDMYDYAWIENKNTGRVVWEMTYRMTDRAGGARKNRVFNDTISLEEGEYDVYFKTDDSHSFEDWNDTQPDDPESWGITIYHANND